MAAAGKSAFSQRKGKHSSSGESNGARGRRNSSLLSKGLSMPNISTANENLNGNGPPGKSQKDTLKRKSFRLSIRKSKKSRRQAVDDKIEQGDSPPSFTRRNSVISSGTLSLLSLEDKEKVFLPDLVDGEKALEWLINPVKISKFFEDVWEKKPLYIRRKQPAYSEQCFSTKELDLILRKNVLRFTENIDVTSYVDGQRHTLNPDGRAIADTVWDYYNNGCSVRLLNPQTFSTSVWKLASLLQDYFGSFVGANIYLTPPSSQGFAPHYDDIEAFVIQLEGKKHWRLYQPRSAEEVLPQFSSQNFSQDDIGMPILDRVLEAGDVLYFPRGYIHQACSLESTHSLHITISVYQKQSWGDFLEKVVSRALSIAVEEDVEFRQGLPVKMFNNLGVAHSSKDTAERSVLMRKVNHLLTKMVSYCPIDAAADQFAVDRIQAVLPPLLTKDEKACTVFGNGSFWGVNAPLGSSQLLSTTKIRLLRPNVARLVFEGDQALLYHSMENSRVYCERPSHAIEIDEKDVDAVEQILTSFPKYISISELQSASEQHQVSVSRQLYSRGIIRTDVPLAQDSFV